MSSISKATTWVMVIFAHLISGQSIVAQSITELNAEMKLANDDTAKVRIFEAYAWAYCDINWDSAKSYATQAILLGRKTQQWRYVAYAASDLANYYVSQGDIENAKTCLDRSLELRTSLGNIQDIASGHNQLGNFFKAQEDYVHALEEFRKGIAILPNGQCLSIQAKIYDNIGLAFHGLSDFKHALEAHQMALKLNMEIGDSLAIAKSKHNLALFFQETRRPERAMNYYADAIQQYRRLGNLAGVASILGNQAMIWYARGEQDTALHYLLENRSLLEHLGDTIGLNKCYNNLALIFQSKGMLGEAERYHRIDLEFCKQHGLVAGERTSSINLATLLLEQNRYQEVLDLATRAAAIGTMPNDERLTLYDIRAKAYAGLGDYETGMQWLAKHQILQDSMATTMTEVQNLTDKYLQEKEKHEKAIQAAEVNAAKLDESIAENGYKTILIIAGILTITVLVFAVRSQKLKLLTKQAEVDIALARNLSHQRSIEITYLMQEAEVNALRVTMVSQERERHRIAKDLHDRVGSKLSVVQMLFQSLEQLLAPLPAKTNAQYEKVVAYLDEVCDDVREVARSMHSGDLAHFGLQMALERFCDQIRSSGKLQVNFQVSGTPESLEQSAINDVYSIVRTLVDNVVRHAKAQTLHLQLYFGPEMLKILVADDGQGFDNEKKGEHRGIGLQNVEDRVAKLQGSLKITSMIGDGCSIEITVPYKTI